MKQEIKRRNGFIISDVSSLVLQDKNKGKKELKLFGKKKLSFDFYRKGIIFIKSNLHELKKELSIHNGFIFKSMAVLMLSFVCIFLFLNYYSFATVVFSGNKPIASASSYDLFESTFQKTKENMKNSYGIDELSTFKTMPVIISKSRIDSPKSLSEKMLMASPFFQKGCRAVSQGKELFTAKSEKEARSIIKKYTSDISGNGKIIKMNNVEYESCIIPAKNISSSEECLSKMYSSSGLDILTSVVLKKEENIPYETETKEDSSIFIGESKIVSQGTSGKKSVFEEIVYENGLEKSRTVCNEEIISQPTKKIVHIGTKVRDILSSGVMWPLHKKAPVSSPFGMRWGRMHEGIDIAVPVGTVVLASESGTVDAVSENAGGYGKYVRINHGGGVMTAYAHLSEINVHPGQTVKKGETIAHSGNTGRSTGPHLHFEVIKDKTKLDPMIYIKQGL